MATQPIPKLKEVFSDNKEPNGQDFANLIDSFEHKNIPIEQTRVRGLAQSFDSKADKIQVQAIEEELPNFATKEELTNVTINNKGYKSTIQELRIEYPNPLADWFAYIGETNTIWVVKNAVWIDSGDPIPSDFDWSSVIALQEGDSQIKAISQNTWTQLTQIGNVRDWVLRSYKTNEVVRHKGLLWIATTDIQQAEPSNHLSAWKLYDPFGKSAITFSSHANTLTINLVENTVTFSGSSTNKIITPNGSFYISPQIVNCNENPTYFMLVYNLDTGLVRAVPASNNTNKVLGANDYSFAYVLNLSETLQDVFGIKGYTLINSSGTTIYPLKPQKESHYNNLFSTFGSSRTEAEKIWLNKAIVNIEFYNADDDGTFVLYGIGKNYGIGYSYLGFIYYRDIALTATQLYTDEFDNGFTQMYDSVKHSGIKTYYLRSGKERNYSINNIYGKVTINWDAVPNGQRVVESNSGVINNSNFGYWTYKKSNIYRIGSGLIKFAKSRSFDEYFNAPQLESYSSPDGIGSMIPKAPYQDCREWLTKWDELIDNCPLGYTVTKKQLTDKVPTDTTESGYLPMYAFNFKPNILNAGDSTGNNTQILPKVVINCSIHGFEKTPSFVVYELIKQILFNWKSHSFLEYLRFNVEFSIIPFANPHGWNTGGGIGTRTNFKGVDLNRNFSTGWYLGEAGTSTFGGYEPLSEIETKVIDQWLQEEFTEGAILGIDFHNFHGSVQENPKNYNLVWIVNILNGLGQSCANVLIKELTTKFKDKSELIPQDEDYFIGTSNTFLGNGMAGSQMKGIGYLYSCTFEVAQNFRFDANFKGHDSNSITFGVESFTNFLRVYLSNFIDEYNRVK